MTTRPWSRSEIATLRKLYPSAPRRRVVAALGRRSWGSIKSAAHRSGVRREPGASLWTRSEDRALRRLYPSAPRRAVLAALRGRGWGAVQRRAAKLAVRRVAGPRPWTPAEEALLRAMWPEHARRTIRARLGRTWDAVVCRARRLGLAERRGGGRRVRWAGYVSVSEAARRAGYTRPSFLLALRAYQRHFRTIPKGPARDALPSPALALRGRGSHRVVDAQAVEDAVAWWVRLETARQASARIGVSYRSILDAARRSGARLRKFERREPAWWDAVAARGGAT